MVDPYLATSSLLDIICLIGAINCDAMCFVTSNDLPVSANRSSRCHSAGFGVVIDAVIRVAGPVLRALALLAIRNCTKR